MQDWDGPGPNKYNPKYSRERRPKAAKNRKKWCGGHVGREHLPVWEFRPTGWRKECVKIDIKSVPRWFRPGYYGYCVHEYVCSVCGKIMERGTAAQCPTYGEHNRSVIEAYESKSV